LVRWTCNNIDGKEIMARSVLAVVNSMVV
jgi:hypothetical protein